MTLVQLRYFCTAARFHSITKAADFLFVTQPTVSIAIKALEKEFSMVLFTHASSGLVLTEEGEIFYEKAISILNTCDDLQMEYAGSENHKQRIRIGIPPLMSTIFFPELLDRFHEVHPDIWLELQEFGSVRACELVQEEELDIGLVNMEMHNIDKFRTLPLLRDRLLFCVFRGHPLADEKQLPLEMLHRQPIILYNQDSVQNRILQSRFEAKGVSPRIILRSSQITTILRFLEKGRCGCFFYGRMLSHFPALVGIPLSPPMEAGVGLITKKGRYIRAGMKSFLDFCRGYYVDERGS